MKGFDFSAYTLLKQFMIKHPEYAVYVLLSLQDLQFYIGYMSDFKRRMEEHEHGKSKSTACRRSFICLFVEYKLSKSDALRREKYFKTSGRKCFLCLMIKDSRLELKRLGILIEDLSPFQNHLLIRHPESWSPNTCLCSLADCDNHVNLCSAR